MLPVKYCREDSGHEVNVLNQMEEGTPGQDNPGSYRDLGTGQGWQRGGNRTGDSRHRITRGTPLGNQACEGSTNKRWRPMVRGAVHVTVRGWNSTTS